ncbi:hypothetical protein C8F04DRAFT_114785 [Mycena alexandri]|uniref:Uncharacterized protein n=1 Tax=Mycena alexandri TaxID=1745969 RepID=A0AAD6TAG8_9AGAR|nr:hypothetical protein C8F04DRAFT_114785 [Mycena alexandri]
MRAENDKLGLPGAGCAEANTAAPAACNRQFSVRPLARLRRVRLGPYARRGSPPVIAAPNSSRGRIIAAACTDPNAKFCRSARFVGRRRCLREEDSVQTGVLRGQLPTNANAAPCCRLHAPPSSLPSPSLSCRPPRLRLRANAACPNVRGPPRRPDWSCCVLYDDVPRALPLFLQCFFCTTSSISLADFDFVTYGGRDGRKRLFRLNSYAV